MRMRLAIAFAAALWACGPSSSGGSSPGPAGEDADGDGIRDSDEDRASASDTDRDGAPDYLDLDSDGDSLPDELEAGDTDLGTPPIDSDDDQQPDFRDLDSDDNQRDDELDGAEDRDGDRTGDYADLDDDGDFILDRDELGPVPAVAVDSDGDGTPDFHDLDSDDDAIADGVETREDFDRDGSGNFQDLDSDGDCRSDRVEAGGAPPHDSDGDLRYDFLDRDSDDDGLADRAEDASCDGVHQPPESDALRADSDGDGVDDLVERTAETNPNDATDNPRANGDFVFVVPYQAPAQPATDNLNFRPALSNVDVYVLLDRSASMSAETQSIKDGLGSVISALQCPPLGTGAPDTCISNLQAGLGGIGYQLNQPFVHYLPIQPRPDFAGTTVSNVGGTQTREPLIFGLWTALTNFGSAVVNTTYNCGLGAVQPNASCAPGTTGQACFRPGALPVLVLATDEPALTSASTLLCPGWQNVTRLEATSRKAKVIGVYGADSDAATIADLRTLAGDTGSVDASAGDAPLVFDGADANTAAAIGAGIRALARGVPLDMSAVAADQPGDAVDAAAAFIDHLETLQLGTPQCADGLTDVDSNGDSYRDRFLGVRAGVPLCWKLTAKSNTTVPARDTPQLLRARVDVLGDGVTVVDSREVFFVVPPRDLDPPAE
jgi:hypothetical protein